MIGRHALEPLAPLRAAAPTAPAGGFAELDGEEHYRIAACDRLRPFLVSLPGATDLWMFVTSRGGLTAGRVDPDGSLFPYVTVDRLHRGHHHTGPLTLLRVARDGAPGRLWEPFGSGGGVDPAIERNLAKNLVGNRLVFEEVHHGLALAFRYAWEASDEFGWVRTATLENRGRVPVRVELLDGVRNVLPWGAPLALYQQASNLVDAYKTTEVDPGTGLGIFSLTAGITDRAEAREVLRANVVWSWGLAGARVHPDAGVAAEFRRQRVLAERARFDGAAGSYLVSAALTLETDEYARWHLVADAGLDHVRVAALRRRLRGGEDLERRITDSLAAATDDLRRIVASADGLQRSGRPLATTHHFANVLFNGMRGGVFTRNHEIPRRDFAAFVAERNRDVAARHGAFLRRLPGTTTVGELRAAAALTGDADLARLAYEYLPLFFGRRHGDPSRPWNRFSIRVRDRNGERRLHYEGNWRDIFQNWEALCVSFPEYLPSVVAKFVNASTVDGFNPYRIGRDGVDWETVSADDPWSNIGYWGDHQIVYLLRLLEAMHRHDPGRLDGMFGEEIFSYADVPYRIRPYADLLRDTRTTIDFDTARAERIAERVAARGTDGKLVTAAEGAVRHVNLLEKLLVPALSKLSNLVPGGGIWMNTQRPEWNDANNALAGGGLSVVTLCHLRRYLAFLAARLEESSATALPVSAAVRAWFADIEDALAQAPAGADAVSPGERRRVLDRLGGAFSSYRERVYAAGLGDRDELPLARVAALCRTALALVDRDIAANRRDDGLYHTYNVLVVDADGGLEIGRLQEMLEGQVAVLGAGVLDAGEALAVLRRLFASRLYRAEQHSFMLYPDRRLPGFLERNAVPADALDTVPLLRDMLAAGDGSLVARDVDGTARFHGSFGNAGDVAAALDELAARPEWSAAAQRDRQAVLDLFEGVFRHREYTGRSGVMYAYEGLGCIYWHMVAKLLLAVQENLVRAERERVPGEQLAELARMYFRVRAGIGYEKTVAEYGAFPADPYSHTPPDGGAKQPGMTGQVKEEILTRRGELGVAVEDGSLCFRPTLLERDELLPEPGEFRFHDRDGDERTLSLPAGGLAFTICQVPVVYAPAGDEAWIHVEGPHGAAKTFAGDRLPAHLSAEVFARSGRVDVIRVGVPERVLGRLAPPRDRSGA